MKKLLSAFRKSIQVNSSEPSGRSELFGSIFFIFISLLLTAVNVAKHVDPVMTTATSILAVSFTVATVLAAKKLVLASRIVIVVLCGTIFSMFALIGGNDGFAILWILLVPVIGSLWVGFKFSLILGFYFQIFLVVLFYTPLSKLTAGHYSQTFMLRFPMLYLASFGAISFMMWQREKLFEKLYYESYYDALTGLHNRRFYNEKIDVLKKNPLDPNFVYFSFDLNRLKYANDNFGHNAGDELLKASAEIIGRNFKGAECFRTGGDEFIAFSTNIDAEQAVRGMKEDIAQWKGEYMSEISISVGYAGVKENPELSFDELAVLADARMYEEKSAYYERNGFQKR